MIRGTRHLTQRGLLQSGAGIASFTLLGGTAFAQVQATLAPMGAMVEGTAKPGPFRIAFSNGFTGFSWPAMALAALEGEAATTGLQGRLPGRRPRQGGDGRSDRGLPQD